MLNTQLVCVTVVHVHWMVMPVCQGWSVQMEQILHLVRVHLALMEPTTPGDRYHKYYTTGA